MHAQFRQGGYEREILQSPRVTACSLRGTVVADELISVVPSSVAKIRRSDGH
jgi:hypothetical protein